MYIKACLPKWNAFSLIIPAHALLFSSLHSPHKIFLVFSLVRVIQWLAAFDFLLCSLSVIFLCVSVKAYTCLHVSPMEKNSYIHLLSFFNGPIERLSLVFPWVFHPQSTIRWHMRMEILVYCKVNKMALGLTLQEAVKPSSTYFLSPAVMLWDHF